MVTTPGIEGRYFPPKSKPSAPAVPNPSTDESTCTPPPTEARKIAVSRIPNDVRGHTSYLTFATLLPLPASKKGSTSSDVVGELKEKATNGEREGEVKSAAGVGVNGDASVTS